MRAPTRVMAAATALAFAASGCIFGGGRGDASSYVVAALTGVVEVLAGGGDWRTLREGEALGAGTSVRVHRGGNVSMQHGSEAGLEVRTDREVPAEVSIEGPDRVEVSSGDVLVTSTAETPISVSSRGIVASATDAVFRFDRQLSVRVGVYDGEAVVASPEDDLALPALREGVVAGRVLPRVPSPLRIDPADQWDARLLSEVIATDVELEAQKRGYQAEFGRRQRSLAPLRRVLPGRPLAFLRPHLESTPSGDLLVALVLSILASEGGAGSVPALFRSLTGLQQQGATWGLLAYELGVAGDALTDAVVRAIGLRTGEVEEGTSLTPTPSPTPEPTSTTSQRPRPTNSPSQKPTKSPRPSPTPTDSPSPSPTPSEDPTCFPGPPPLCTPGT